MSQVQFKASQPNCQGSLWQNWINNCGQCGSCPNNDTNNYWYPLFDLGFRDAKIMVIADTPTYNIEDERRRTARVFETKQNRSADRIAVRNEQLCERLMSKQNVLYRVIKGMLADLDIGVSSVYFTNTKKCGDIKGSTKDNKAAYKHCADYLQDEIAAVKPEIIITIGRSPMLAVRENFKLPISKNMDKNHKRVFKKDDVSIVMLSHWGHYRRTGRTIDKYIHETNAILKDLVSAKT